MLKLFTWRRSFPEGQSQGADVDEKDERDGGREARQQTA